MAARRTWVWRFDHPPALVWPILADTVRFNEAAELPKHKIIEAPQADGTVHYMASLAYGPYSVRWRELPVDWVEQQRFRHRRVFVNGPFRSISATLELRPEADGSRVDYTLEVVAANLLGTLLIHCGFMNRVGRTFARLADTVRGYLAGVEPRPYQVGDIMLAPGAGARVARMVAKIEGTPHGHGLAQRLADHVLSAQESDLVRIRPLALAAAWGWPEREVAECCLVAVKTGLLEMRWDLLCPRCQGAKETVTTLDQLPVGAHCGSCNIDYERNFSRNVEITFHPAAAVRPIVDGEFCLFGPMTTPHVKVQQTLAAHESLVVTAKLDFGAYRLRTLHPGGESDFVWSVGGFPEVIADGVTVAAGAPAAPGEIRLVNRSDRELIVVVESRDWVWHALTADRVAAMQAFRDMFSDAVLRPGDQVGIANVTIMFTDLKGSTAMYSRVGDAGAYHQVREHFAYLANVVRENNGAVVKTIGDAVMAVFTDPADGVHAALAIQRNVAGLNARVGNEPLVIKVGLHAGPCIAVTLNERLDYFGSTVNLAARLQGMSVGDDVVLSQPVATDPAVARLLSDIGGESETADVRGFPDPVPFTRLTPEALRPAAGQSGVATK